MTAPSWNLSGAYFETCNCNVVCPCYFFSDPTYEECTVVFAWHVEDGRFGDLPLDDLNFVVAARRDRARKWSDEGSGSLLYLDRGASQAQKDALTEIFTGRAGGVPSLLTRVMTRLLAVRSVAVEIKAQGKTRSLRIPETIQAEIEALAGQGGSDVTLGSIPNAIVPGQTLTVAQAKRLNFRDHGFKWELSGRNGVFSRFVYQGP